MTHTPGPWAFTADMYGLHNMRVFGAADARGNGIANCGYDERGECEANARLIAAAPELLAALQYLMSQTIEMDEKYGVALSEGEHEAALLARAAIAKAKGN